VLLRATKKTSPCSSRRSKHLTRGQEGPDSSAKFKEVKKAVLPKIDDELGPKIRCKRPRRVKSRSPKRLEAGISVPVARCL